MSLCVVKVFAGVWEVSRYGSNRPDFAAIDKDSCMIRFTHAAERSVDTPATTSGEALKAVKCVPAKNTKTKIGKNITDVKKNVSGAVYGKENREDVTQIKMKEDEERQSVFVDDDYNKVYNSRNFM